MYRASLSHIVKAAAIAILCALPTAVSAQDAKVAPIKLTPEEIAEREGRKACKVQMCGAFRAKKAGDDINCDITKSWRKAQLDKVMKKARASWPWGPVVCKTNINLKREDLIKATAEAKFQLDLKPHTIACTVQREKEPANIKFSIAPKVQFENGKATKASLNWGKIEAPTLVKGAMWTATATDNTFNVLESTLVEDINDFISKKCDEVKSDWQ